MRLIKRYSIGFLVLSFIFLAGYQPVKAGGATLYLSPAAGSFVVDSTFDISVLMNTNNQSVNAVSMDITFPAQLLQVVKPVANSSVIAIWIAQPSFSNTDGKIHLEGGIPNPGVNSSAASIMGITFRAKQAGIAKIRINDGARVLANDGAGTDIIGGRNDGTITLTAKPPDGPSISSDTHPDQNSWYQNLSPQFSWISKDTVSAISYQFDQNPTTEPDQIAEAMATTIPTQATEDGLWYFHLRVQSNKTWGGTSHYLVHIDNTAPAAFEPVIDPIDALPGQKPVATFITTDRASGIDHYELKVESLDNEENSASFFTEQQSPYVLPMLEKGRYQLTVRAFDKAGNITEGLTRLNVTDQAVAVTLGEKPVNVPFRWVWSALFVGLLVMLLTVWLIKRRGRRKALATLLTTNLPSPNQPVPISPVSPPIPAPTPPLPGQMTQTGASLLVQPQPLPPTASSIIPPQTPPAVPNQPPAP